MPSKSLVNAAYEVLTQHFIANGNKSEPLKFSELLLQVGKELDISDEEQLLKIASRFYRKRLQSPMM